MNIMTLVSNSYSDSNLMYLNWAVSLPAYFAGHFTGIVFRRQNAILVDSIDFVLKFVLSTAGIGQVRAADFVNFDCVAALLVPLGVVVSHHSVVQEARTFIIRNRRTSGLCGGNTACTQMVAKGYADDPSTEARAHHLRTPTTFGFGVLERVPGQSATFCWAELQRTLLDLGTERPRAVLCKRKKTSDGGDRLESEGQTVEKTSRVRFVSLWRNAHAKDKTVLQLQ